MTNLMETFATITHRDFNWPYNKPIIVKPGQPPMNTGKRLYLLKTKPEDCKCDAHSFQNDKNRYKHLANKELRIRNELEAVNLEMVNLTSKMLKSTCESDDDTMRSIYTIDYKKRGLPVTQYSRLMAAADATIDSPIEPAVAEVIDGYRDPTRFRYSAIERPTIQPAKPMNLLAVPETLSTWEEPFTGRSEYMDTISKIGLSNMKNRQQYLEPMPSSRRKFGDCKI